MDAFAGAAETGQVRPGVNDPPLTLVALGRPHEQAHGVAHARQHGAGRLGLYQSRISYSRVVLPLRRGPVSNKAAKPRLAASAMGTSRRGVSLRMMDTSKAQP